jgi:prolyl oligopeptidase
MAIDLERRRERTILPAVNDSVLIQAQQLGNRFVLQYLEKDLTNTILVTDLKGKKVARWRPSDLQLPDRGTLSLLTGDRESRTGDFTYHAANLPTQTLRFDGATDSISLLPSQPVPFDGSRVQSTVHYYLSRDGVRIPIQVFSRTDALTSPIFAYLFMYGNIGIASASQFNRKFQLMLELGGVVAVANIRGGGEFGLPWQKAGTFTKWKSLEDIAAAAQWLRKEYPSIGRRIALSGRSFGGTNTMACYVYLQDDFDVFTPVVSLADPEAGLGESGWWAVDDYGFRRDRRGKIFDAAGARKKMATWNPMRGISKLKSPKPFLAFSGEFDMRVHPDQTTRFVEALIKRFGADAPIYMIETEKIGHSGRAEYAEEATFIARQFGIRELRPLH